MKKLGIDLYDLVGMYEHAIDVDDKILAKISLNIEFLREVFTEDQLKFIRYLLSLDRDSLNLELKKIREQIFNKETEHFAKLFEKIT